MNCVQCVVGRVQDLQKKEWAILDRSGDLAHAVFNDD